MNYKKEPLGWIIEEDVFDPRRTGKCESIFAQGNGYMNIRCTLEESYVGERRGAFITGTFNKALPDEVTELPNLPDVTEMKILVNGGAHRQLDEPRGREAALCLPPLCVFEK